MRCISAATSFVQQSGPEAARRVPPVVTGSKIGVAIGAGTDAHRVASYNPFTGVAVVPRRQDRRGRSACAVPRRRPTAPTALRFYTLGSAWFSHDDDKRGSLEAGKLADLAVLSKDYSDRCPIDRSRHDRIGLSR